MSEFTDTDRRRVEWIRDNANRKRGVKKRAHLILADHAVEPPPSDGLNFSFLFPKRQGTGGEERYQSNSTYLNASADVRRIYRDDALARGENTIMFDVTGGENRYIWPQEEFDFFNGFGAQVIEGALLELWDDGLKGLPLLYTQHRVKTYSWEQIRVSAERHAAAWGHLIEPDMPVWAFFEVGEGSSVPPLSEKIEGGITYRGDDWVIAAAGIVERAFDRPVGVQWGQGEINHNNYQGHIPHPRNPKTYPHPPLPLPQKLVVLYQFVTGDPRDLSYRLESVEDWKRTLDYPSKHGCADRMRVMALEHSQIENNGVPSWSMEDELVLTRQLAAITESHPSGFKGSGMGV